MAPLENYWEDTYIGRQRRNRRANPRFSLQLWNVRDRVIENLPRTNNSVEAWHRSFQQTIDGEHPSVYKLVEQFRREQDHYELKIEKFRAGIRHPEASKSKYVRLNRRRAFVGAHLSCAFMSLRAFVGAHLSARIWLARFCRVTVRRHNRDISLWSSSTFKRN